MTTKQKYQKAYSIIRSTKYEKTGTPRSYYQAYQYTKKLFGEEIATAAYNSQVTK